MMSLLRLCLLVTLAAWPALPRPAARPALQLELYAAQNEAAVGQALTWLVKLEPVERPEAPQPEGSMAIRMTLADPRRWAAVSALPDHLVVTTTLVISLQVAALAPGELIPAVLVSPASGGPALGLAAASAPVRVKPADAYLQAGLQPLVSAPPPSNWKNRPLDFSLHLQNGLPFPLENIQAAGEGAGLDWGAPQPLLSAGQTLAAGQALDGTLQAAATGSRPPPQARVRLELSWRDDLGRAQAHTLRVHTPLAAPTLAAPLPATPAWLSWLLQILESNFFGVLLGGALAILGGALSLQLQDWKQRRENRHKLRGLLELAVRQAEYAAGNSQPVDTLLLEKVYHEPGLWQALLELGKGSDLLELVSRLRDAAHQHNQARSQPGGSRQALALGEAARRLKDGLSAQANQPRRRAGPGQPS